MLANHFKYKTTRHCDSDEGE